MHNVTVSGSAVPPQMLLFASLNGSETLGSLFTYIVQLKTPDTLNLGYISPAANLPLKPMVGKDLCVNIELDGGGKRHISGLVTAARIAGHEGRSVTYELRIEPWVKLLTHTSDYKAFQNKTVVDILDEVLAEYPYPVEKRLVDNYPTRAWQVQYGESDFDFIQRLMQEWGIYWWFEHSEDSHTLVLADAISAHKACPDSPLVEWHQEGLKLDKEFIHTITANESLRTGQWVLDDFDFTRPRFLLTSTVANPRETGHADYEHYEWPGDYFDKGEGEMLTRIRMEAQRSPGSRVHGGGNIRTLMTGYTFALDNHPTAEVNREYLLVQTTLLVQDNAQHSGQDQHFSYSTSFELHPTSEVYRPQRTVSKPHTKGPQSAIVTGPAGQEIWTDKYGRVKVQFGWDRYGKRDENSSCWIRVSYPWAGKGFGMIQIPRIGQEVLVDFKNGDPDLPIIVGRTYNQDTMPPWGLPDNATQSGIYSRSINGGYGNANALRFEDKPGQEEVWLHAEKDQRIEVEHDESHWVGNDRQKTIDGNETVTVHKNRTETVDLNESINIHKNRTSTVDLNAVENTGINKMMNIGVIYSRNIGIAMNSLTGLFQAAEIGLTKKLLVGQQYSADIGQIYRLTAGQHIRESAGKTSVYSADEQLELVCGKARLVLDKDGGVYLQGTHIEFQAENTLNGDAGTINWNCEVTQKPAPMPEAKTTEDK